VIETSSSLPLYQSLPGCAPISTGEVLEMDLATLAELPATAPPISSCTPAESLMHWIWCHLPLLSPGAAVHDHVRRGSQDLTVDAAALQQLDLVLLPG
jgi:hypothetical protein